ncbi:glycosyltransferase family 2 protein [Desulfovibrio sp. JC022]|uniref:glycosyltransferase family 2 protein n=1 Tax=Desulfovibrio sp. JC022 TaxID=2593642 RepID=UPI0013D1C36C|nr:glycosyltransferase family 2 protein [Desulfovibrio sp. JC022]NDV24917.1 glycosyltransferase family 2 protein [Desulfovibrio sp. JC022]
MPSSFEKSFFAIILVHYGAIDITLKCLASIRESTDAALVVISNNGTKEQGETLATCLESCFKSVAHLLPGQMWDGKSGAVLVDNCDNIGFANACNNGIAAIRSRSNVSHVWLLNNDTQISKSSLNSLKLCSRMHPRSIIGTSVVRSDNPQHFQLAGGVKYSPWTSRIKPAYEDVLLDERRTLDDPEIDYIYGASMLIPIDAFSEVGMLNGDFFLYYEELDFCVRAKAAGYTLHWCRDCIVIHELSATIGRSGLSSSERLSFAAYHEARSTILFTLKFYPAVLPAVLFLRLTAKPLFLALRGEWSSIPAAVKGLWAGLVG